MSPSALILFELVDHRLGYATKAIRNRILSEYEDMPWTPEQRAVLEPLVRRELDLLIQRVLGVLDNVGGILPDETLGWTIRNRQDSTDIRDGNRDYADMWLEFLNRKTSHHHPQPTERDL